jgi:hypothetical protein
VTDIDTTLFGRWKYAHHTALNNAIINVMPYFVRTARYPRRAFVVITDGEGLSKYGDTATAQSIQIPGAPYVYFLDILDPYAPTQADREGADFFGANGVRTVAVSRESTGEVQRVANEITVCISSQYAITYTTSETLRDKRPRKIQVSWPESGRGTKVTALKGYWVPAP